MIKSLTQSLFPNDTKRQGVFGKKCRACGGKITKNELHARFDIHVRHNIPTNNYQRYKKGLGDEKPDAGLTITTGMIDGVAGMFNATNAANGKLSSRDHSHPDMRCLLYVLDVIAGTMANMRNFLRLDCKWSGGKDDYEYMMVPAQNGGLGYFISHTQMLRTVPVKQTMNALRAYHDDPEIFLMFYSSIGQKYGFNIPVITRVEPPMVEQYRAIPGYAECVRNAEIAFQQAGGNGKDKMRAVNALAQYALSTEIFLNE